MVNFSWFHFLQSCAQVFSESFTEKVNDWHEYISLNRKLIMLHNLGSGAVVLKEVYSILLCDVNSSVLFECPVTLHNPRTRIKISSFWCLGLVMIYMACICTIWSLYVEGPLSTNIMLTEKHVLPLWNIVMCTDGQSQLAYFLPSSTEFHLTPNLKTADSKLMVF
jgi:hypothetical protein